MKHLREVVATLQAQIAERGFAEPTLPFGFEDALIERILPLIPPGPAGPKGDKGPRGNKGEKGDKGEPGLASPRSSSSTSPSPNALLIELQQSDVPNSLNSVRNAFAETLSTPPQQNLLAASQKKTLCPQCFGSGEQMGKIFPTTTCTKCNGTGYVNA